METQNLTYKIAWCYLSDHAALVDPKIISTVEGFLRGRNIKELTRCTSLFDDALHTIRDFEFLRQMRAFFNKNACFTSDNSKDVAFSKFVEAEKQCQATNIRLDFLYSQRHLLRGDLGLKIKRMEFFIEELLGDFKLFLDRLPAYLCITAGATSTSPRARSLPQLKMKMSVHTTLGSTSLLRALYRHFGFEAPRLIYTERNRVEFVPKNFETDRTIACEPEGILPLQLAFDGYIKRRLLKYGVDLSDQTKNQQGALRGSIDGSLATIDFKSASDTVAYNTVAWLMPVDWFRYLETIRCKAYTCPSLDVEGSYHKFSSMGNGTTFCLETLIFTAACRAIGSKAYCVYGDDVVLETELVEEFVELMEFFGMTINQDKSFIKGPFRESCGADWFDGRNVTPVYLRGLDGRKAVLCHVVNTLGPLCVPDGKLRELLDSLIREHRLPYVPYQESTVSGVWLHPRDSRCQIRTFYRCKCCKRLHVSYVREFKAYVPQTHTRKFAYYRGYYLWFLLKHSRVLFQGPYFQKEHFNTSPSVTSVATIFEHKYVRKWVTLAPSQQDSVPDYLYWWPADKK